MKFIFYSRDSSLKIVTLNFFTNDNGFDNEDRIKVEVLKVGESLILGMDDAIITRIWDR